MATSLVSQIMQFLTPDLIGRIAAMLGIDRAKAEAAVATAVPALLAAFSGAAAQPARAQKLADAVGTQGSGPGDIAGMFASGDATSVADKGTRLLSSLLGARDEGALAGAVGEAAGIDQATSRSLLGMLAPAVLGGVARQAGGDLSPGGISALLADQKGSIAAALPAGLRTLLPGAVGSVSSVARTAGQGAASAASAVAGAGERAAGRVAARSSNWLYWAVPVAAALALIAYFLWPTQPMVEEVTTAASTAAEGLVVEGVDVGQQVTDGIGSLTTALSGVTDEASARTALPKLEEVGAEVDAVAGQVASLSADQKKVVAGMVGEAMPALTDLIDKVLAIPGVAAVLGPPLDALKAKLTTLAA